MRVADPLMDQIQDRVKGANVHLVRGKLALESKRYQEAAAELRKAIEARPDMSCTHKSRSGSQSVGRSRGAAQQFQKAMAIDPNNLTAHYNLAVLWANKKRHDEAIVHLQKVVTLNPNDRGARFFLANNSYTPTARKKRSKSRKRFIRQPALCNTVCSWSRRWQNSDVAMTRQHCKRN